MHVVHRLVAEETSQANFFPAIVCCDERACISADTRDLLRERPITSTCSIAFADQDFRLARSDRLGELPERECGYRRICSLQANIVLLATVAFSLVRVRPAIVVTVSNGSARIWRDSQPSWADRTGYFETLIPGLPGGQQAIRILTELFAPRYLNEINALNG